MIGIIALYYVEDNYILPGTTGAVRSSLQRQLYTPGSITITHSGPISIGIIPNVACGAGRGAAEMECATGK